MNARRANPQPAFTLIELLVVIAIIAVLAALLVPVLGRIKARARINVTQQEMREIIHAIYQYETAYGQFPISGTAARSVAPPTFSAPGEDFTFGCIVNKDDGTAVIIGGLGNYKTNNSEVMAVLLDLENFGSGWPTINQGHVKNPKRIKYLDPRPAADNYSHGLAPDGLYRDLWGSPYVITLDLNHDGAARDAFYRQPAISADAGDPNKGLCGLTKKTDADGKPVFEVNAPMAVWSLGPDKRLNWEQKANQGDNKDNILSWRQ